MPQQAAGRMLEPAFNRSPAVRRVFLILALSSLAAAMSWAQGLPRTASPAGASVYFISPTNGAKVSGEVLVRFGLKGMGVAPAGSSNENTGHHHLIVDALLPPEDRPIPMDEHHLHFG